MISEGFLKVDENGRLQPVQQSDSSSQGSRNVQANLRSKKKSDGPVTAPIVPGKVNVQLEDLDKMEDSEF
jgi:hypothetical protein